MGLKHRHSNYARKVWMGKRTIKDGEAAVVWHRDGRSEELVGPKLKYLWFANIQFLDRYVATSEQYLAIAFKDGRRQNIRGPVSVFLNRVFHNNIEVIDMINLVSEEHVCIVSSCSKSDTANSVSSIDESLILGPDEAKSISTTPEEQKSRNGRVEVRVIHGPALFLPDSEDRFFQNEQTDHGFQNEQTDDCGEIRSSKIWYIGSRAEKQKVQLRLADGGQCHAEVLVQFRIHNVEKMVQKTKKPAHDLFQVLENEIAKQFLSVTSMTILDSSARAQFLRNLDMDLLDRKTAVIPNTENAAARIGVEIESVRVVDVGGLQEQYEKRIQQKHAHEDALEQVKAKELLEKANLEREERQIQAEFELRKKQKENEIKIQELDVELMLRHRKAQDEQRIAYLRQLMELNVDLNRVLKPISLKPANDSPSFMDS